MQQEPQELGSASESVRRSHDAEVAVVESEQPETTVSEKENASTADAGRPEKAESKVNASSAESNVPKDSAEEEGQVTTSVEGGEQTDVTESDASDALETEDGGLLTMGAVSGGSQPGTPETETNVGGIQSGASTNLASDSETTSALSGGGGQPNLPELDVKGNSPASSLARVIAVQPDAPKPETEEEESSRSDSPESDVEKGQSTTSVVAESRGRTDSSESEVAEHQSATDSTKTAKFKKTRKKKDKGKEKTGRRDADISDDQSENVPAAQLTRRSVSGSRTPFEASRLESEVNSASATSVDDNRPAKAKSKRKGKTRKVLLASPNVGRVLSFGFVSVFTVLGLVVARISPAVAAGLGGVALVAAIVNVVATGLQSYRQIFSQDRENKKLLAQINQLQGSTVKPGERLVTVRKIRSIVGLSTLAVTNLISALLIVAFLIMAIIAAADIPNDDTAGLLSWLSVSIGALGIALFTVAQIVGHDMLLSGTLDKLKREFREFIERREELLTEQVRASQTENASLTHQAGEYQAEIAELRRLFAHRTASEDEDDSNGSTYSAIAKSLQMPEGEDPGTLRYRTDDTAALTEQASASSASTHQSNEVERDLLYGLGQPRPESYDQENDSGPKL